MSTTEVGVGYVRLLPSMEGFSGKVKGLLSDELSKPARDAGEDAGREMAKGIADGMDGAGGQLQGSASKVGDFFKVGLAAAGLAGAALLTSAFSSAMDLGQVTDKLTAQLGGGQFAEAAGEAAADLYVAGFGDSVADTADIVRQLFQGGILDESATQAEITAVGGQFATFADVLEQDMDMATQAVQSMLTSGIADSSAEALDIMTAAIQQGADKAGDLSATFQEYGTSFRDAGIDAADAAGLMVQGLSAGARDADKVADAIKEFGIRAQDGSKLSAEGFAAIGLSADEMTAAVARGGPEARAALDQVLDGLRNMTDPAERNAAAIALFGTQAEDLGDALFSLDLDTAAAELGDYAGATDGLGSAYDNAASKIESFKRGAMMALTEFIGGTVIPKIERLAEVLGPPIQTALGVISDAASKVQEFWTTLTTGFTEDEGTPIELFALKVRDALSSLQPVVDAVRDGWTRFKEIVSENPEILQGILVALGIAVGALAVALGGLVASAVVAAAPFIAIGVAVAAVAAGILWLYNNVESFRSFVDATVPLIGQVFQATFDLILTLIQGAVTIGLALWRLFGDEILRVVQIVFGLIGGIITGALNIILGVIRLVTSLIKGDWSGAWEAIKQITSGAVTIVVSIFRAWFQLLGVLVSAGWSVIRAVFSAGWSALSSMVSTGINNVVDWFKGLPAKLRAALATVASAITSPFSEAFSALKRLWNNSVGGFGFSVPDWVPVVGGKSFKIPKMHTGGVFDPGSGTEGLALLKKGEGVFTPDQMAALGGPVSGPAEMPQLVMSADGDRYFLEWIRHTIRVEGGNVQMALGQGGR